MKNTLTFRFLVMTALLLGALGVSSILAAPEVTLKRTPLRDFPASIGEWVQVGEQSMDKQAVNILKVDDYIMRTYRNAHNQTLGIYIGYFTSQREGKGSHSPRQCLPGAGWSALETTVFALPPGYGDSGGGATANRYLMSKGDQKELYIFWYQGRGRAYASEYRNKLYLVWDGLRQRRTDGALIRINVDGGPDEAAAFETANGFVSQIAPVLGAYIPE